MWNIGGMRQWCAIDLWLHKFFTATQLLAFWFFFVLFRDAIGLLILNFPESFLLLVLSPLFRG